MVAGEAKDEPLLPGKEEGGCKKCLHKFKDCTCFLCEKFKLASEDPKPWRRGLKMCGICCLGFFIIYFVIGGIIQFIMFHYATMGCNAGALEAFDFPSAGCTCKVANCAGESIGCCASGYPETGGPWPANATRGHEECVRGKRQNLLPTEHVMLERPKTFFGQSFAVYKGSDISEGSTGAWWRTWGPWFWTYVYEENGGIPTVYVRPTVVGMIMPYSSSRVMRCDGGDVYTFTEGSNWIANRVRRFWGAATDFRFKIYENSDMVSIATEQSRDHSIRFVTDVSESSEASAVLTICNSHMHDCWAVHPSTEADGTLKLSRLPNYVESACTVLLAFRYINWREDQNPPLPPYGQQHQAPSILADVDNSDVEFFSQDAEFAAGNMTFKNAKELGSVHA